MFTGINADGTASEMKLKNDDEIVLMNGDVFAPSITHNEALQIFLKIKVDGRSSFKMVIRRKKVPGCCGGSGWTWIELSTTFTLKREIEHPIKVVTQSQLLRRNRMEMSFNSLYLYKIQGTQRYITIDNGHVYTDTLAGDESDMTKRLLKHEIVSQYRNEDFSFTVALSDHTRSWFIADDKKGRIVLRRKPCWFGFTCAGGIVTFKTKRRNYLAYDHTNNQLRLRADRFCLEEIEVPQRRKQLFKR
ncbi:uncharacterized protein LOC123554441 isoform X2 [Mercenaria mercenaria]|uniref:uncharacterized protein LOC123554441 isoform X2 n=1 Tax=Mercenaria mercenaria TaxID=6596 RepID=UPI00234F28DB|nr:uncharacterized protein LOC123554441 isoform X2 [Mercenaria mercenaria]